MRELQKRIGFLRILLADIEGKQMQLTHMEEQYRSQLARVVEFAVYREGDVGNALSLMSEVQLKLDEVVQTSQHLGMIASKAQGELEVLLVTKRVAEARSQLAKLEDQQQELLSKLEHLSSVTPSGHLTPAVPQELDELRAIYEEVEGEISRLQELITEASERAARSIQSTEKQRA